MRNIDDAPKGQEERAAIEARIKKYSAEITRLEALAAKRPDLVRLRYDDKLIGDDYTIWQKLVTLPMVRDLLAEDEAKLEKE